MLGLSIMCRQYTGNNNTNNMDNMAGYDKPFGYADDHLQYASMYLPVCLWRMLHLRAHAEILISHLYIYVYTDFCVEILHGQTCGSRPCIHK